MTDADINKSNVVSFYRDTISFKSDLANAIRYRITFKIKHVTLIKNRISVVNNHVSLKRITFHNKRVRTINNPAISI